MGTEQLQPIEEKLSLGEEIQLYPMTSDICPYMGTVAPGKVRIAPNVTIQTNVITGIGLLSSSSRFGLAQAHYALDANSPYKNMPYDSFTGYSHFNLETGDLEDACHFLDYPNPHLNGLKYLGGHYSKHNIFEALETFKSFSDAEHGVAIGGFSYGEESGAYFRRFISLISEYEDGDLNNFKLALSQQFFIPDQYYMYGLQLDFSVHLRSNSSAKREALKDYLVQSREVGVLSDLCSASLGEQNRTFEPVAKPRLEIKYPPRMQRQLPAPGSV